MEPLLSQSPFTSQTSPRADFPGTKTTSLLCPIHLPLPTHGVKSWEWTRPASCSNTQNRRIFGSIFCRRRLLRGDCAKTLAYIRKQRKRDDGRNAGSGRHPFRGETSIDAMRGEADWEDIVTLNKIHEDESWLNDVIEGTLELLFGSSRLKWCCRPTQIQHAFCVWLRDHNSGCSPGVLVFVLTHYGVDVAHNFTPFKWNFERKSRLCCKMMT